MRDNKEVLLLWFIGFLIKKSQAVVLIMQLNKMNNWIKNYTNQLLENLIWGADLSDMQLINKLSKRVRFLLCVIDIFSKYACVVTLKDKKGGTIVNAFQNILKISTRKPYKIWRDKAVNFITDQ